MMSWGRCEVVVEVALWPCGAGGTVVEVALWGRWHCGGGGTVVEVAL